MKREVSEELDSCEDLGAAPGEALLFLTSRESSCLLARPVIVGNSIRELLNRRLELDGVDDFVRTSTIDQVIASKTLVAWASLNNLTQQGGGLLSLENPTGVDVYDGIVYAEQLAGQLVGKLFGKLFGTVSEPPKSAMLPGWFFPLLGNAPRAFKTSVKETLR